MGNIERGYSTVCCVENMIIKKFKIKTSASPADVMSCLRQVTMPRHFLFFKEDCLFYGNIFDNRTFVLYPCGYHNNVLCARGSVFDLGDGEKGSVLTAEMDLLPVFPAIPVCALIFSLIIRNIFSIICAVYVSVFMFYTIYAVIDTTVAAFRKVIVSAEEMCRQPLEQHG